MSDPAGLVRLALMFSPAFPVGAFAYSQGLEQAAADGLVDDAAGVAAWLSAQLDHGAARADAVLFARAFALTRDGGDPAELHDLALALAGSGERHVETSAQGAAFLAAAGRATTTATAFAVAAGSEASRTEETVEAALALFLAAWAANQMQVAIRLGLIGATAGVAVLERLEAPLAALAATAAALPLGGFAPGVDIAAMRHERASVRLFRS